jgi:post-segregation antitoxin (ccd killing protein)
MTTRAPTPRPVFTSDTVETDAAELYRLTRINVAAEAYVASVDAFDEEAAERWWCELRNALKGIT